MDLLTDNFLKMSDFYIPKCPDFNKNEISVKDSLIVGRLVVANRNQFRFPKKKKIKADLPVSTLGGVQ